MLARESPKGVGGDGLAAVVGDHHRAHIRMDHEAGQCAQHEITVVGIYLSVTFRVLHRDHAIDIRKRLPDIGKPLCQRLHKGRRPGGHANHNDEVPRADATRPRPPKSLNRRGGRCGRNLGTRLERGFIEHVGRYVVLKVGLVGEREVPPPPCQSLQDAGVADVRARGQIVQRDTERQSPREQRFTSRDGIDDDAVSLENGVGQGQFLSVPHDDRSGLQAPAHDSDVVAFLRDAGNVVELNDVWLFSH